MDPKAGSPLRWRVALRRVLRSRFTWVLIAAILSVILLANLAYSKGLLARSPVALDEARQLRNPLAMDLSTADASPEASQKLLKEMLRIKASVKKELADLEKRRARRMREINQYAQELRRMRLAVSQSYAALQQMHLTVASMKQRQDEVERRNLPLLRPPLLTAHGPGPALALGGPPGHASACSMHSCFAYEHCGLTTLPRLATAESGGPLESELAQLGHAAADFSPFTAVPAGTGSACLRVAFSERACGPQANNCLLIDANGTAGEGAEGFQVSEPLFAGRMI